MAPQNWPGVTLLRIASLYLVTSLVLGAVMAATHNHALVSVHSHIGLLGWATLALTGLAYLVVPGLAASRLTTVHFWLHNAGLPVMVISLAALALTGDSRAEPLIGLGSVLVLGGLVAFTINAWQNAQSPRASESTARKSAMTS